jgi:hypothetical protein
MRFIFVLILVIQGMLPAQQPITVLKLNWGTGDDEVGFRQAPEANYGPQAFAVNEESVLLLDSENGWLKVFTNGKLQDKYRIPPYADDFYFTSPENYFILNQNRINFYREGECVGDFQPASPRILIQFIQPLGGDRFALNLADGRHLLYDRKMSYSPDVHTGWQISQDRQIQLFRQSSAEAQIRVNGKQFTHRFTEDNLASLNYLGSDLQGRLFMNFEFFIQQVPLYIRREIAVLSPAGQHLLTLDVPVNNFTHIFRDVFVDNAGVLYRMISTAEGIEIVRWNFDTYYNAENPPLIKSPERFRQQKHYNLLIQPKEVLPAEPQSPLSDFDDYQQVLPEDALATGDEYERLVWNCSANNLTNGVIVDPYGYLVQTPGWIQVGTNQKVPYKWGGFEDIEQFLYGLDISKYAGDNYTNKSNGTPSAVGVDCSGFVSRCWNLPFQYSTRMMDDAMTLPYGTWQEAEPGDAVHKPGHVRLLVQHNGNGSLMVVESSGADWRVSYRSYFYNDLTTYTPRYYVNRQGAPGNIPQPRFDFVKLGSNSQLHWSMAGQENTDALRLYSSSDGATWNLVATLTDTTQSYSFPIADGEEEYFRLSSISSDYGNEESQPSDIYGVYRKDHKDKVLIVDGFDRTTSTNGNWQHIQHPFTMIHGQALYVHAIPFETADNDAILRGDISLNYYTAVFWILGDESTRYNTFTRQEQEIVAAYLQQGGKLFVTGSEIAWDLWEKGTEDNRDFFTEFLKATYQGDNSYSYSAQGEAGSPFAGLSLHFDDGSQGIYRVGYPDVISPEAGSSMAFHYANGLGSGVYYEGVFPGGSVPGKLFYLGFPFETVYSETERNDLMERILEFFDLDLQNNITGATINQPVHFVLYGNYPNPFNGQTSIRFRLPGAGRVELRLFNTLGQSVLQKSYFYSAPGEKEIAFSSEKLSSGKYFYRLTYRHGNNVQSHTHSMLIVK